MIFRNLRAWQFTGRGRPRTSRLLEQLAEHAHVPCRPQQPESIGWLPPDGSEDGPLVVEIGERQLFCLGVESRPVPATAVRTELLRRAREQAARNGRPPRRAELGSLREAILAEFQPRAFSRLARCPVVIDAEAGLVLAGAVGTKAEDRFIGALRASLGTLPIKAPVAGRSVPQTLSRWLRGSRLPSPLALGTTAVLRDPRNRSRVVRVRGAEDLGAEVAAHLEAGFEAVDVEVTWADRLRLRLADDLAVRGLAMLETDDAPPADENEDPAAEFAATALVESATLVQAIRALHDALGVE